MSLDQFFAKKETVKKTENEKEKETTKTLISTEKSFLSKRIVDEPEIIKVISDCVAEIKDQLEIKPPIIVFNRECRQARDVGFFSDESEGYHYSRQLMFSKPLTNNMKKLIEYVNNTYKSDFNGILVNRYNHGLQYIGAHSDDERTLDKNGVIALSWGATRKFRIRDKSTKKIHSDVPLSHLSIVHMGGEFQKEFTHEIPIEKKVKEPRISFTFRKHLK